MANSSLKQVLEERLVTHRTSFAELRVQLNDYKPAWRLEQLFNQLLEAEDRLDQAQLILEADVPDLGAARGLLHQARQLLDVVCRAIAIRSKWWELTLALWAVLLLAGTAFLSIHIWKDVGGGVSAPEAGTNGKLAPGAEWSVREFLGLGTLAPGSWLILRAALLAVSGGLAGASINLGRILYLAIPSRTLDPRSVLWYWFSPFFAAALAGVVFMIIRAGFFNAGGGTSPDLATSAGVFAVGFLIGFVPTAVYERLKAVVRAIFGTEEVRGPQIAPPAVRVENGRLKVEATVTASASTRVAAVTALFQGAGGSASVALQHRADYGWAADVEIPAEIASLPQVTVVVEARDEAGNVNRSQPSSVGLSGQVGSGGTTPETGPPRVLSTNPIAGQTVGPDAPLVVQFSTRMEDADPALTDAAGTSIEVEKSWSSIRRELTVIHPALPAGTYRLALENMLLPDGTEIEAEFVLDFIVTPPGGSGDVPLNEAGGAPGGEPE